MEFTNLFGDREENEDQTATLKSKDDKERLADELNAPDGGWGWVVVAGAYIAHCITDGTITAFGVIFPHMVDAFPGTSQAKIALIGSLMSAVPVLTAPITSLLTNKLGCRRVTMIGGFVASLGISCSAFCTSVEGMMLTMGIIAGFGYSLVYIPGLVIVAKYFDKYRSFASGLALSGSGIGVFVLPPLMEALKHYYGWRGAVFIMGAMPLQIIASGAVYLPLKRHELKSNSSINSTYQHVELSAPNHSSPHLNEQTTASSETLQIGQKNLNTSFPNLNSVQGDKPFRRLRNFCFKSITSVLNIDILKSRSLLWFSLSNFLFYLWYDFPYVYIPIHSRSLNIPLTKASLLLSLMGIMSTLGQIGVGYLGDKKWINPIHLYNVLCCGAGLTTVCVPFLYTYAGLAAYAGLHGVLDSGNYALSTVILVKMVGIKRLTNAFGLLMLAQGIASLSGSPLAGLTADVTGSYDLAFYLAGICVFVSGIMLVIMPYLQRCDHILNDGCDNDVDISV